HHPAARAMIIPEETRNDAPFNPWQSAKGLIVAAALLVAFVFGRWPREHVALIAAGVLLMSRKLHSNKMLGLVDWELLVLFIGLFVVNHALQRTGLVAKVVDDLAASGMDMRQPGPLFFGTFLLSNVVSNVPAVMLLLPLAQQPWAGPLLALVSTLAGNLLIVGSIANIIVVDNAARRGNLHRLAPPRTRRRTGDIATLTITAVWLALHLARAAPP
ncbi:MAG TPA: SLC13 family permease, partial [Thermoanaerobaculia bacterium]